MSNTAAILDHLLQLASTGVIPFETWIRRHRLEPLIYGVELPQWKFDEVFMDECRHAYFNMIGRANLFTRESEKLVELLSSKGIRSYAWRGVIHGQSLYGDPALRYCTDIDLMVAPAAKWEALKVMLDDGYRLRSGVLPKWYLARHHLHWPLISADGKIPVDLHWAVDHPYQQTGLNGIISTMDENDISRCIICLQHAEKESRFRFCDSTDDMKRKLLDQGPILPWFDVALIAGKLSREQLQEVERRMPQGPWRGMFKRSIWICHEIFGISFGERAISEPSFEGRRDRFLTGLLTTGSFMRGVAEKIGCRPEALTDWVDYLDGTSDGLPLWQKVGSKISRTAHVLKLFLDTVICGLWMVILKPVAKLRGVTPV
jgi:hypothetical protein